MVSLCGAGEWSDSRSNLCQRLSRRSGLRVFVRKPQQNESGKWNKEIAWKD